ncbi:unnamed protein product [Camellia sinensis]
MYLKLEFPTSSKKADHPSRVSVLEALFMEDVNVISPGSECFERVNVDLHGLPMQLKLRKMESGANADGLMLTPSDKDIGQDLSRSPRIMKYDDVDPDTFVSTWYSLDCPLDPCLFDNVEKKYSNETTSLREASEEKSMHEDMTEKVLDRKMQWLDSGDGVDAIGMEIEKLLMDDLIVEVANMLSMD